MSTPQQPDIPPYRPRTDPFGEPGPQDVPAPAPRQRRRGGGILPIPHRSWTTRRGTRVTVGGCCLPLPLGCLTTVVAAGVAGRVVLAGRRH